MPPADGPRPASQEEARRIVPTAEDRRHLLSAMKDIEQGWCLHPFTCARFRDIGWLDRNGWTQAAYNAARDASKEGQGDA